MESTLIARRNFKKICVSLYFFSFLFFIFEILHGHENFQKKLQGIFIRLYNISEHYVFQIHAIVFVIFSDCL